MSIFNTRFNRCALVIDTCRAGAGWSVICTLRQQEGFSRDRIAAVLFSALANSDKLKLRTPAAKRASKALFAQVSLSLARADKVTARTQLLLLAHDAVSRCVATGNAISRRTWDESAATLRLRF